MLNETKRLTKIKFYYLEDFIFRQNIASANGHNEIVRNYPDIDLSFADFCVLFWAFRDQKFDGPFSKKNKNFYSFAWSLGVQGKIAEIRQWKNWNEIVKSNFSDSEIDDSLRQIFNVLDRNAFRLGLQGKKYDLNSEENDLTEILFNRAGLDFYYGNQNVKSK